MARAEIKPSKGSARELTRARVAMSRDGQNEGGSHHHLALSVTRVAICVSQVLLDGLQKKRETAHSLHFVLFLTGTFLQCTPFPQSLCPQKYNMAV